MIELTDEQLLLRKALVQWYLSGTSQVYAFTGPSGSGKSTIVAAFIEHLGLSPNRVATAAYVGKAVLVLLRKGVPARTIHSLIYNVYQVKDSKNRSGHRFAIKLKDKLDEDYDLIVIDEGSMVDTKLEADILSFGVPTIFLGDMNQLPPINGTCNVLKKPDFELKTIMRQAEGDPIIQLSQMVLNDIPLTPGAYGKSSVVDCIELTRENLARYDVILTAKNMMRGKITDYVRHNALGINTELPIYGERVVCRQNNWGQEINGIYLTNGLTGTVEGLASRDGGSFFMDFKPDFMYDDMFEELIIDKDYFLTPFSEKALYGPSKYEKFEYAYCLSVHISQGSEMPNVLYVDDFIHDAETTKRARYTAITRATESVTVAKSVKLVI